MEAGTWTRCLFIAVAVSVLTHTTHAADFRTQNFIVQAPDAQLARAVGQAAEKYRRDLAKYWLGTEIRHWPHPCPIRVIAGPHLAAQGVTTYNRAPVRDFQMEVVGSPQRILDSVLPHEVTHTILATHFGRPLPRWADEGICTTVEHASERRKHEAKLLEFLSSRRGIAMNRLFLLTEYPPDVLPMYAQGYSVCRFLIDQKGPRQFVAFLKDYMQRPSWTANVRKHYGYESLRELQDNWVKWVEAGSGDVSKFAKVEPGGSATSPATLALTTSQGIRAGNVRTTEGTVAGGLPDRRNPAVSLTLNSPRPQGHIRQASDLQGTALASATEQGWYERRRNEAFAQSEEKLVAFPGDRSRLSPSQGIMPPSVRGSGVYSAAQPQAEQSWSRSGAFSGGSISGNDRRNWR